MQCFFSYCVYATGYEFSNFNFGTVDPIKRNLSSCTRWVSKLKVRFCQRYCTKFILTSPFVCLQSDFLFQHGQKATEKFLVLLHILLSLHETY